MARMFEVFRSRRMAALFLLGFSSGLPLYLTGSTLQAWMTDAHVSLDDIAAMNVVGLAYTFKFAWAPLLDRFTLPFLGRRRGWLVATQVGLVVAIAAMGLVDPAEHVGLLAALALAVAVLSASQDVVVDAYTVDVCAPHERAAGSSMSVIGYRTAMLITGTLALVMADHLPWRVIYATMAVLMAIGIGGTLFAAEPPAPARRFTLAQSVYEPFTEFWRKLGWRGFALAVAFTLVYKFGDYFAQSLLITFLKNGSGYDFSEVKPEHFADAWSKALVANFVQRGAGFRFTDIAVVYKVLGFAGIYAGAFFAGSLVARFGMRRMLLAFGVVQAMTNLLYAWLATEPRSFAIFSAAVLSDNLAGAMGTAAFVAFLMSLCSPAVSATQFALLTSLSSLGQRVFGPLAAPLVGAAGWTGFFITTSLMAIPGLVLAYVAGHRIEAIASSARSSGSVPS
ncbi:MAG: MFS transporter [Deltaproteobacteria bacterium]|nr:MFS transporter [Deltaproteobacteria bacterium]